jgi:hypothetical protein
MKFLAVFAVMLLASFCLYSQTALAPAEGDGTANNPYQIATLENLYWIAASNDVVSNPAQTIRWQSHYLQTANIDASETVDWFNGQGWSVIGDDWGQTQTFRGSYNGQGFHINGLYINRPDMSAVALIGYTNSATVQNLGLTNVNITGNNIVGAIMGRNDYTSSIINCYSTGAINGNDYVGGLAGWNRHSSTIQNSFSTAAVEGSSIVGGLVGYNTHSAVIENCFSSGSVTGNSAVGGLVGSNRWGSSTVLKSYSTGLVTGNTLTGGFAGQDDGSTIGIQDNCFWDSESSGYTTSAGQAQSRTTTEMVYPYAANTFADWDFVSIWREDDTYFNGGYPFFQWQPVTAQGNVEGTVSLIGGAGNISDVVIDIGYFTVNPDPTGYYSVELHAGVYNISASLFGYQTDTVTGVVVEQNSTTSDVDFVLGNIEIEVTPSQLQVNIEHGETASLPLTITNDGNGDLSFSISLDQHPRQRHNQQDDSPAVIGGEIYQGSLELSDSTIESQSIARDKSPLNHPFTRVAGWNHLFPGDWGDPATDGIGIINPVTWYAGTILDLSDDLGGEITRVAYYDYDAAGGITAQVYSGNYSAPTELLSESSLHIPTGSNSYVVLDLLEPVEIQDDGVYWIVIKVLDLGTGFFPLGTVNPHIENGGKIVTTDPLTTPWGDLNDYGFNSSWIIGAFVEAEPWIFANPVSGTVPAGESLVIDIELDSGIVWTGTYTADIIIDNDAQSDPVTVPVSMTVLLYNPYIIADTESFDLNMGVNQQHNESFTITNIGGSMMLYNIDTTAEWLEINPDNGMLMPEEDQAIELTFNTDGLSFGQYSTTIVFDHNGNNELEIPVSLNVTPVSQIEVLPAQSEILILPDTTQTEIITITNSGDGELEFSISVVENDNRETDYSQFTLAGAELNVYDTNGLNANSHSSGFNSYRSGMRDPIEIHYDLGYDNNGVGTGGAANWISAVRFTPDELIDYYDYFGIMGIRYHIRSNQFSNVTLKIWEGGSFGNPNTEIYSHDVTSQVQIEEWSTHYPEYPIPMIAGNEYWIGYAINTTAGYPSSVDAGPTVAGKGGWIFIDNQWQQLSDLGINFNWCIRGLIDYMVDPWISVSPRSGIVLPGQSMDIELTYNSSELLPDTTLTADLVINNNSLQGPVSIPATMHVVSVILEPPLNLSVDEATALFSWEEPDNEQPSIQQHRSERSTPVHRNRPELISYHVYLDGEFQGNTRDNTYQLNTGILSQGVSYTAGVRAVYDQGQSIMRTVLFTYDPLHLEEVVTHSTELGNNFPNPFNPETTILFSVETPSRVHIEIYDIKGRKVRSLVDKEYNPGEHKAVWDGKNDSGKNAGSGIYFYRMRAGGYTNSRKMILLK